MKALTELRYFLHVHHREGFWAVRSFSAWGIQHTVRKLVYTASSVVLCQPFNVTGLTTQLVKIDISNYRFSNYVEFKLAKILQLIDTIKRTIFRKVRTETILKIYNTLVLPTFLYG